MLVGCFASFSDRPPFPTYSGPSEAVPVVVSASYESYLYSASGDRIDWPLSANLGRVAEDAVNGSDWVRSGSGDETISNLDLSVIRHQGPGPNLLSFLTAYFIPGTVDISIDIAVKLISPGSEALECERSREIRVWYQTLLIFVYPFRSPTRNEVASVEALTLECLAEILRTT